jgi:hypothetical protein
MLTSSHRLCLSLRSVGGHHRKRAEAKPTDDSLAQFVAV